jgi:hypothetical protein
MLVSFMSMLCRFLELGLNLVFVCLQVRCLHFVIIT